MSHSDTGLTVLLDEGAPVMAGEPFRMRGHKVIQHNEVLPSGAKDREVAAAAVANKAILIAVDRDMKAFPKKYGKQDTQEHLKEFHLIVISCNETQSAHRLKEAMSFIEHEWRYVSDKKARRLWIDVGQNYLKTNR